MFQVLFFFFFFKSVGLMINVKEKRGKEELGDLTDKVFAEDFGSAAAGICFCICVNSPLTIYSFVNTISSHQL